MIENPWSILWIVLAVIGGLLIAGVVTFFFGKVRIRIRYRDDFSLSVNLFWLRFAILEQKQQTDDDKKRDLSRCRAPALVLRRELRRSERAAERAYRKALREKKKKLKKQVERKLAKKNQPKPNLKENLEMIGHLIGHFYNVTGGRIGIRIRSLRISVGAEDAAKTALLYGAVLQGASLVLELINSKFSRIKRKRGAIAVVPDFLANECHADVDIICETTPLRALRIYFGLMEAVELERTKARRKAARRLAKKRAKAAGISA